MSNELYDECKKCKLAGSIGLNQICDVKPQNTYISGQTMNTYQGIREISRCIENGQITHPVIGVRFDALRQFRIYYLPYIGFDFVLVLNDGDNDFPSHVFEAERAFVEFLNDPRILHIYSQNNLVNHPKITSLPIGMDYHTLSVMTNSWGPITSPLEQERQLFEIRDRSPPFWQREIKCYSNFHFFFGNGHGQDRKDAISKIPKELVIYQNNSTLRYETWTNQVKYAFVISPHGNGLDCHRTWEAINLGCLVIVKNSVLDILYEDLPVLIVNDWSNVTQELLNSTVEKFKNKKFNMEKLTLNYWKTKFKSHFQEK